MCNLFVLLCWFLPFIANVNAESCNYATFSVKTLYPEITVGTFSFSTNRCQALKAALAFQDSFLGLGFKLPFDGSVMFECQKHMEGYYQLAVKLYSDPLCNDLLNHQNDDPNDAIYVDLNHNNKFKIYEDIQFSLDELSCDLDLKSCGVSLEMAQNCSWSGSDRYINISVPDSHCVSLAPDFKSVLGRIPFEILPEEIVEDMEASSMDFKCCESDNSLLISNYSDTSCDAESYYRFRISDIYNGHCFVIGNDEDIIESDTKRGKDDEDADDSYVFILSWTCNVYEYGCDEQEIPIVDESMLPPNCSERCMETEKAIEKRINGGDNEGDDVGKGILIKVIGGVVALILVFVLVIVVGTLYRRRKMDLMSNQIGRNIGSGVAKTDDKYAAFVSVSEDVGNAEMPKNTVQ